MLDSDLDQDTLELILELQLQDVEGLMKGKHREGDEPPDAELSIRMYKAELDSLSGFASDRAMCQSIARAVMLDGDAIAEHDAVEQQAVHDREQAEALEGGLTGAESRPRRSHPAPNTDLDDELLSKLQMLYVDDRSSVVSEDIGEPSSRAAARGRDTAATKKPSSANLLRSCVACSEDVPFIDTARCPCSHEYCRSCIAELFQTSIVDESLSPPRCCGQPITLGIVQIFLSSKLVGEFRAKEIEYGTPNRTYCHRPTCSTFVPPQFIRGDVATCMKCRSRTCVRCKGSCHDREDCPENPATQELLRVATENGWQRCQSCNRMVELSIGCNHITCLCGAQFCYICGRLWKSCMCEQWDENRLLDRAYNIVDRMDNEHRMNDVRRANLVAQQRQNLIVNHECTHPFWRNRQGRHRCEECRDLLPLYICECTTCRILACRRCRFNRL